MVIYHFIRSHSLVVLYHSSKTQKYELLLKIYKQIWDFFVLQSLLGSLFLALRTTLALMRSCVRSQELCARTMTMEDTYQVKITLQSRAPNVDSNSLT